MHSALRGKYLCKKYEPKYFQDFDILFKEDIHQIYTMHISTKNKNHEKEAF